MANFIGGSYITSEEREKIDRSDDNRKLLLNPWTTQSIVYKIIQNYLLSNDPKSMGYTFDQKYDLQKEKSQIDLEIAYHFKPDTASKRPAIFIGRDEAELRYPVMGGLVGTNPIDSEEYKLALVSLPIIVSVVASPIGFVEQLADYVKQPLMYFSQIIQCDFGFQRFRLKAIGKPKIYIEAKDNFVVELALQVEYSDNWIVRGDHLKLKTFSATIFDSVLEKPLENQ